MALNIPLDILDEYAKTISSKLANMLYESKCNKKFKKPLYENMKYQDDNSFSIYLDYYTLNESDNTVKDALVKYVNKYKLQYNTVSEGVYLYTPSHHTYTKLIENLVADGFNVESLKNIVTDKKTLDLLEKLL